jgi:hypothetical protein
MTEFVRSSIVGVHGYVPFDRGARMLAMTAPQGTTKTAKSDWEKFETEIRVLQSAITVAGATAANDAHVRELYVKRVTALARDLRQAVANGSLTWKQAAEQAQTLRNDVMDTLRRRTSPYGATIARGMKRTGKSLNTLVAEKTLELFGPRATFANLSEVQRNTVYGAIVDSAGKANPRVNASMGRMRAAGRALLLLSLAISVYTIATADDKADAALKETATMGASIAGGIAGGAIAGLACGPGAPVCVAIGMFVGGALAGLGASSFW